MGNIYLLVKSWGKGRKMEKNKMSLIALHQTVDEAHDKKDWKQVIKLCTDIIKQNPKDVEAFNSRGAAYVNLGQLDQAIALNPKYVKAFYNRGTENPCVPSSILGVATIF